MPLTLAGKGGYAGHVLKHNTGGEPTRTPKREGRSAWRSAKGRPTDAPHPTKGNTFQNKR
eukprot:6842521-Prymnesium_polylepis.1